MKKDLRSKLPKYSAAAVAAVAAGSAANAQVTYTAVNKTITAPTAAGVVLDSIDINTDGMYDIAMAVYTANGGTVNAVLGGPINAQGHAMAGSVPSSYNYPFKLANGAAVNTQNFLTADSAGTFTLVINGATPYNSFWNDGVIDGYLGVKLSVGGNTHYGWVRMDMTADGKQVVIKDMAYNATANGAITAGQGQLSVPDMEAIASGVWVSGKELHTDLQVSFNSASVRLMDLSGKEVFNTELTAATGSVSLEALPVGVYVVSLNVDGNTFNKKVVLQ